MAVLSQSPTFIECEFESDLSLAFGGNPVIHTIEVSPGVVSDKYWKVMRGTFIETTILSAPFITVIDTLPLPTGAATAAGQSTGNASLSSIDSKLTNPLPISGTVTANTGLTQPLTDVQLRATAVPVSGTFFQATQPISAATLPLPSGAATAANQQTDALTDAELRATAIPTKEGRAATPTLTNVASSATNVTLLASNANRLSFKIYNDSTQILYVKFGATATSSSFVVKMFPESFYEDDIYTGLIDGIWASANGAARITELTA